MNDATELIDRRGIIINQIAEIGAMRRGSLTSQFVEAARKDGETYRRGPYVIYSFKEKGKTVSRRIKTAQEKERYQGQINAYRRFQTLAAELVEVSQQLADLTLGEQDAEKKTPRR
jgi:hypothetical protein